MTVNVNQQLWDTANRLPTTDIFIRPRLCASEASGTVSVRSVGMGRVRRFLGGVSSRLALSRQVSKVGSTTANAQKNSAMRHPASATTMGTRDRKSVV